LIDLGCRDPPHSDQYVDGGDILMVGQFGFGRLDYPLRACFELPWPRPLVSTRRTSMSIDHGHWDGGRQRAGGTTSSSVRDLRGPPRQLASRIASAEHHAQ
jgi:hypothetical protein